MKKKSSGTPSAVLSLAARSSVSLSAKLSRKTFQLVHFDQAVSATELDDEWSAVEAPKRLRCHPSKMGCNGGERDVMGDV